MKKTIYTIAAALSFIIFACSDSNKTSTMTATMERAKYETVRLDADLSALTDNQKEMIKHLIVAAKAMDQAFWKEAYGSKAKLLDALKANPELQEYAAINYGPWDRLNGNAPFVDGYAEKPLGANFYPADMTIDEFNEWNEPNKKNPYSLVQRDSAGKLLLVPYHTFFDVEHETASEAMTIAAKLSSNQSFKKYLMLRAAALRNDDYQPSDFAWMDVKNNDLDLVIGPIENYEDRLFGYRTAHEAYVLLKDRSWSERLQKYASLLPALQKGLPVEEAYKAEKPGSDADLAAYDILYYAGDCNAGSKTIAINLPNDEEVQLKKGSRRLQLKNAMQAKFDKILLPIADVLIDESQRDLITFDAFFNNTMFHEVAHGLGIKNTINGKGSVRDALKAHYSALEEGKADILGLYMVNELIKNGELEADIQSHMVTFMAGIFRSVRFGASSAHGVANMLRFNYFLQAGAFTKTPAGTFKVDFDKMEVAIASLSDKILRLQGDGNFEETAKWVAQDGIIKEDLQLQLDKLQAAGIPVDVVFEQGEAILGLK